MENVVSRKERQKTESKEEEIQHPPLTPPPHATVSSLFLSAIPAPNLQFRAEKIEKRRP